MFTPQRNSWSALSKAPRMAGASAPTNLGKGKGKAVAYVDGPPPPPPPVSLLNDAGEMDSGEAENMEDWRRFREAGLLDEAAMERRDKAALLERVSRLENELLDYQHAMGLLLIEKKEETAKLEELRESAAESEEVIKRERASHLIALTEVENREENLREALDLERQLVADLKKHLLESRSEYEQVKLNLEAKVAEANALMSGAQGKSFEVKEKLSAADAKLTEASRKSLELDRKLMEIETRESVLRTERMSLKAEKEAHEATLSKHKEDLRQWEKKLQEVEERQCEGRRILNEREERVNGIDKQLKQREKILQEEEEKIHFASSAVKTKEEDLKSRLDTLHMKEKKAESLRKEIEAKEKGLNALTEKLNTRERVEIQKLLDEQRCAQELKRQQFELELEEKRKLLDEELRKKAEDLDQKDSDVSHMEEKLRKREQALENKSNRVKEKEKDIEAKVKLLKEKEKTMKTEEKNIDLTKKEITSEKESLEVLREELELVKAEISQKQLKIHEETETLRITDADRREHLRLQNELKEEIEKCRMKKELLLKETDDLKQDRKKFEEEWEALDEKRATVTREMKQLEEEQERLKKIRHFEEEQIQNEKIAIEEYIKRELEALSLQKESFTANMKHEQSVLSEKYQNDHDELQCEFEALKRDLEINMLKKQEVMEKTLQEKEHIFEVEKDAALRNMHNQKEKVMKEIKDLSSERSQIEKEQQDIALNRKQFDELQVEMRKDIDELVALSKKLKDRRESFLRERGQFLAFIERLKNCQDCGDIANSYVRSSLQLGDTDHKEGSLLPKMGDELLEKVSSYETTFGGSPPEIDFKSSETGGHASWLRKCTSKIFSFSPTKTKDLVSHSSIRPVITEEKTEEPFAEKIAQSTFEGEEQFLEVTTSVNDQSNQVIEEPQQSEQRSSGKKLGKKIRARPRRTHSVKAVIEEAAFSLGKTSGVPAITISEEPESSFAGKPPKKRTRAQSSMTTGGELDADGSEVHSESVTAGGRRKRRQTVAPSPNPGQKRYNLRRHKTAGIAAASQATEATDDGDGDGDTLEVAQHAEVTSARVLKNAPDNHDTKPLVQVTSLKGVETQQIVPDRIVRFGTQVDGTAGNAGAPEIEPVDMSENLNGTPEFIDVEDELESTLQGAEDVDDDEDEDGDGSGNDDDSPHPGEASMGKKIWNFFTS